MKQVGNLKHKYFTIQGNDNAMKEKNKLDNFHLFQFQIQSTRTSALTINHACILMQHYNKFKQDQITHTHTHYIFLFQIIITVYVLKISNHYLQDSELRKQVNQKKDVFIMFGNLQAFSNHSSLNKLRVKFTIGKHNFYNSILLFKNIKYIQ